MAAEEIGIATLDEVHINISSELILHGRPLTKAKVQKDLQSSYSFRDEITIIDGIGGSDIISKTEILFSGRQAFASS